MIANETQARYLRRGTLVVFFITLIVSLFFVYGYHFDPSSQQLVKKSVVLFESDISKYTQYINEVAQSPSQNVLRLVPGEYSLRLAAEGFYPWKRHIMLAEDEIMRLGKASLIPTTFASIPALFPQESPDYLISTHGYWFGFSQFAGTLTITVNSFTDQTAYTHFNLKQGWTTSDIKKIGFDPRTTTLYIVDTTNTLYALVKKKPPQKRAVVRDMYQFFNAIYAIDETGNLIDVTSPSDPLFNAISLAVPYEIEAINDVQHEEPWRVFAITIRENRGTNTNLAIPLIIVIDASGQQIYSDIGTSPSVNSEGVIRYLRGQQLASYNLQTKKFTQEEAPSHLMQAALMRPLGNTFWYLIATVQNQLLTCDRWFENCIGLGQIDLPILSSAGDGFVWYASANNKPIIFDFNPQKLPSL